MILKTWYPLFSRNCHESKSLTGIAQSRSPYCSSSWASNKPFQICFGKFSTVQGECKYNTVYFTLWHFQVPSGTFKHFQTLSGATRIDRSSRYNVVVSMLECCQWLLPVLYNLYRRLKQLNIVFWDVKALAQAALITLVGAGCVGVCEENLLSKQSPEKGTRDHAYNQNGYDTRSRDRCSPLVDK